MTFITIPKNHPRAKSLKVRETISQSFSDGVVVSSGLIAHGRGEAFDYILGEKTLPVTMTAIRAAVAELLLYKSVISVNGNVAALQCKNIITLANLTNSQIEINLSSLNRCHTLIDGFGFQPKSMFRIVLQNFLLLPFLVCKPLFWFFN